MKKLLYLVAGLVALLAAYVVPAILRIPGTYEPGEPLHEFRLLSWADYRKLANSVEPPVVLETDIGQGAALFFGMHHSNDPTDQQFDNLRRAFEGFAPTVVLVEGRAGPILWPFMDPLEEYGESGVMLDLAYASGSDAYTWELPREAEPRRLRERFSREQVAIYLLMRPYSGGSTLQEAEAALAAIIEDRKGRPGIEGVISNLAQFDGAWERNIPSGENWRDLRGVYGAPGFLGEIFEYGNDIRDQHMLNIVRELAGRGERVMVTMGWSHAIRIKPAFDELADSDS